MTKGLLNRQSLGATVDAVNEALFTGRKIPAAEATRVAEWIASRQGRERSYHGLFAPTKRDGREGMTFFTGETISTQAGTAHSLGEEAYRVLLRLDAGGRAVREAMDRAAGEMIERLFDARRREMNAGRSFCGEFCCGTCSAALWRTLCAGGFPELDSEEWLAGGVAALRAHREGPRWRRFPFYYTVLALSEMPEIPGVREELRHAAGSLERSARAARGKEPYTTRRRLLAERVLGRC